MTPMNAWRVAWDWARPIVLVAAVMFPFRSTVADWNVVPTGSMKPTIVEGDRIFVDKLAYDLKVPFTTRHLAQWSNPRRGEIVVFYAPDTAERLVKRVVGEPGDRIALVGHTLVVNGKAIDHRLADSAAGSDLEPLDRSNHRVEYETFDEGRHRVMHRRELSGGSFPAVAVPPGHYLVLGDNRDNSRDSRYFGFVPREAIVGRATHVVVSLNPENYYLPRAARALNRLDE